MSNATHTPGHVVTIVGDDELAQLIGDDVYSTADQARDAATRAYRVHCGFEPDDESCYFLWEWDADAGGYLYEYEDFLIATQPCDDVVNGL